jgi:hypothetical protein
LRTPNCEGAYLDNDVVSAIAKDDRADESDALDRLLAARDDGKVDLTLDRELGTVALPQALGSRR